MTEEEIRKEVQELDKMAELMYYTFIEQSLKDYKKMVKEYNLLIGFSYAVAALNLFMAYTNIIHGKVFVSIFSILAGIAPVYFGAYKCYKHREKVKEIIKRDSKELEDWENGKR